MILDEAIKVTEVVLTLKGEKIKETTPKAYRESKDVKKITAFSLKHWRIMSYNQQKQETGYRTRIYRRTTLYYNEIRNRTDWEPCL